MIEIINKTIRNFSDLAEVVKIVLSTPFTVMALDTETNGLNIKFCTPFLVQFGFVTPDFKYIYTFAIDLERSPKELISATKKLYIIMVNKAEILLGHNLLFDLHMSHNGDWPLPPFTKCADTTIYIRLAHDAIPTDKGGPPLDLKSYAARFLDNRARVFENKLKEEIKRKRQSITKRLLERLKPIPILEELRVTGTERRWTKAMVEDYIGDKTNDPELLPYPINAIISQAYQEYEEAEDYSKLNRENIIDYAHYDIVYTLMIHIANYKIIAEREQLPVLQRERNAMEGFYEMEAAGHRFDLQYATKAKEDVRNYILELRQELNQLTGQTITVNQHKKLKEVFLDDYDIELTKSDKFHLTGVIIHELTTKDAKRLAEIIIELRSVEKWYSTYLCKWINQVKKHGGNHVYPTYNVAGAVTGRVSSDFQQFPEDPLKKKDGTILFHPRKCFLPPEGKKLYYLDYNAMELRIQALYTYLVSGGDLNLLRAYVPHKCVLKDGKHYLEESPETEWKRTDIHGATAKKAFDITEDDPDWHNKRNVGKRGNFAIIYGASADKIAESLRLSKKQGLDIYNAFFAVFPGVRDYGEYIRRHIYNKGYVENLFGRRYYNINAHSGKNYAIQGSCADYTKELIPMLVELFRNRNAKLVLYVHDEFGFYIDDDEVDDLLPKVKSIMESLDAYVPMVVEIKYTDTNWFEKRPLK